MGVHGVFCRSSVTGDASDGYKGSRKYDILKESKATDIEAGPPSPVVTLPPVVADKTKDLGKSLKIKN